MITPTALSYTTCPSYWWSRSTLKKELVAQLDHHISTSREQRNAAKRCATLKEELVAGDLPILAVPFTTAMLSLGKEQMITYKSTFSWREKKEQKATSTTLRACCRTCRGCLSSCGRCRSHQPPHHSGWCSCSPFEGQRNEKGIERVEEKEKEQVGGMGMKFDLDSPATSEKGKVRFYVQKESVCLIIKEGRRNIAEKRF